MISLIFLTIIQILKLKLLKVNLMSIGSKTIVKIFFETIVYWINKINPLKKLDHYEVLYIIVLGSSIINNVSKFFI